mmetsp:Transcript_21724/g.47709  ORF Transcript_21724/g.47709 Transcript_21724/m.47709 type:complete len:285 (-) Transcript_21724:225-1079(-)|eukprot:CAMPEP_0118958218 /NCGR_PEP_ID=MMETSP1169-20130426/62506_1 /TAXON_ID=36882 /ORGANISM="Pyramimonas obovata, Strain CCMP722" /LENGTH=284 /DNA_ID=CAMNT_0006906333 /DNA_START=331 /DNA_END=1185 /DNA_ORIENTATION=-
MSDQEKSALVECEVPACDVIPAIQPCDIHVLLVDDEVLSRMVVANMLVKCGYTVTAVETGRDALERLAAPDQPFTLLMTDVAMPGITGLQILNLVRQTPELDHVPVVMMSAHENAGTVFECVRNGADDYILKPVSEKEVHYLWQHVYRRQMVVKSRRRLRASQGKPAQESTGQAGLLSAAATGSAPKPDGTRKHGGNFSDPAAMLGDGPQAAPAVMSADETRAYCNTMIEKYQKVLYVIENFPELFQTKKRPKSEEHGSEETGSAQLSMEALEKLTQSTDHLKV